MKQKMTVTCLIIVTLVLGIEPYTDLLCLPGVGLLMAVQWFAVPCLIPFIRLNSSRANWLSG
jgi:hypothetical protein